METNINTDKLDQIVKRLCRVSEDNYIDPFSRLEWPEELDRDNWFTSPELISIEGTPIWDKLDESQRKYLSFFEAIGFYSINIHGERMLIEGVASRLYRKDKYAVTPYLHHFLDEEIVDIFNRRQAKDDRLHPLAKEINWLHHFEESRHLSFGREFVKVLWQSYSNKWTTNGLKRIRDTISSYIEATWKEYYNPSVYKDAGLSDPFSIRKMALKHPTSITRRAEISAPLIKFLSKTGILPNAEELPI